MLHSEASLLGQKGLKNRKILEIRKNYDQVTHFSGGVKKLPLWRSDTFVKWREY